MEIILIVLLSVALLALVALGVEDRNHELETQAAPRERIDAPKPLVKPWDEHLPRRRPLQWDNLV